MVACHVPEIDGGIARKDVEFALYLGRIPREEADFVKNLDFEPSDIAFDAAFDE